MSEIPKDGLYLRGVTAGMSNRLSDRLELESMGVAVRQPPVGGRDGIRSLLGFWDLARRGFRMGFRMDREGKSHIDPGMLLKATVDANFDGIWEELSRLGLKSAIESPHQEPAMATFAHTLVTLGSLSQRGTVDLARYETPLIGRKLGNLAHTKTDWRRNINPESVWGMIGELERDTGSALFSPGNYDRDSIGHVLRAAHFFAEGDYISREAFGKAA